MSFLDWFTPKEVLANQLASIEVADWCIENDFNGNVSDLKTSASRFCNECLTKREIIEELNSRDRQK